MFNYCSKIIWDSFSIKLIRTFGLYYLLLVVVFNFIQTNSISYTPIWIILSLISTFTSALYETILIENIRLGNYVQKNFLKDRRKLVKKSWIMFRNKFIASFFILLGLILFVYPGVVLAKRYQYVSLISEDLLMGPIETLKLSRKISEEKGWQTFNICFLSYSVAILPVAFLILLINNVSYEFIISVYAPWIRFNIPLLVLIPNYKIYKDNL